MNRGFQRFSTLGIEFDFQPSYVISVVSRMVGVHAQTLSYYERIGLIEPARSVGNIRLYSTRDVQRLLWIKSLIEDLGVNLAGVEVIIRMSLKIAELEREVQQLNAKMAGIVNKQKKNADGSWRDINEH